VEPDVQTVLAPTSPDGPQRRRTRSGWVAPILTFVVGASLGLAAAVGGQTSEEDRGLQGDLTAAENRAEALEGDIAALKGDVATAEAAAANAAQTADDRIGDAEAELAGKAADLEEREADVAAREKAVTAAEKEATPEPAPEPTADPDLSPGQVNALTQAENYLDVSAFSPSGLVNQLEFEGYSTADATAAVDSVSVDWYKQAARKADEYLSVSSFSESGLVEQLEFEGFTRKQAEYGVGQAY